LGESVRTAVRDLLRKHNVAEEQRLVAIAPGARWETKIWLPERFAETIDQLHRQRGVRSLLLGSRDEVPLCERIAAACRTGPINLAGGTTLPQLGAAIAMSDVVLCHDSAAMHLAVAFERRLVCLVGPTNPGRTGPYGRPDDVVSMKPECAPCYLKKLSQCKHAHRCMRELDTQTVVRAVERALGGESLSNA
jgi:ADP-heptose:LPS heptosyltransferase